MKHWKAASAALISMGLMAQAAQAAAPLCTTQGELSSLRTAALQQQLMVAGLTCHASEAYNRFVLAYRPNPLKELGVAAGIAASGTAIYLWRSRRRREWPFPNREGI